MLSSALDQHIIPLIQYLLNNVGKRAYCSDCNDIWAYENKLVLREDLAASEDTTLALP
jgi:branched-chain amino acid transport system substrate-binding protein